MIKQKRNSKVFDMVEEELNDLSKYMDVSESMRNFNKLRYPQPKHYMAKDVVKIRKKLRVSQTVFAYLMNASESTVKKWETGVKNPGGANCRLLQIIEYNGIKILQTG